MNHGPRAADASGLEADILREITPNEADEAALAVDVAKLIAVTNQALQKARLPGTATVQGSVAKGTWLKGGADIDLFLLLDPSLPEARLEQVAAEVGPTVLANPAQKYAQHPYLTGTFHGRSVDLVPAYAVLEATAKMSAVDRTPFHTEWVRKTLNPPARAQVRLLKAWMKGVGVYGAQTAVGGFSGYLLEVLIGRFETFGDTLAWLAAGAKPRRIALGADQVKDDVAILVVVDPVDPARNCAAAVSTETLDAAIDAAKAYRTKPQRNHFFPAAPRSEPGATLGEALKAQEVTWCSLWMKPRAERMDIVFPQFQRAARTLAAGLSQQGFQIHRQDVAVSPQEDQVLMQWLCGPALPATRIHRGPPEDGSPNAKKFRDKWTGHADAAGPVTANESGMLQVEVHVRMRTPLQWLEAQLPGQPLGKHVAEALQNHRLHEDPATVPELWGPRVADLILDRRPWQR